jgi:Xaa-Pro aminopeptidase
MNLSNRLNKLRRQLAERELDGFLVSRSENRYYLSGFDGSAGYLIITANHSILATDFRYIEQAGEQADGFEIKRISGVLADWLPGLAADTGITRIGFESADISQSEYSRFTTSLKRNGSPLKMEPTEGLIEALRSVKEPAELELIRQAAGLADGAVDHVRELLRAGITEEELAWKAEKYMRERGSQAVPFEVIVASGPNAAKPHWQPSSRPIQAGEPVVIDLGARYGGYASDLTRTVWTGTPDKTLSKVYDTVLGAQLAALSLIKEGTTGHEADSYARTVIEEGGYGDAFGHGLGHGVGLAAHEPPRLGPKSEDRLMEGTVFTVEPGIYLPGWGGVRIEDLAVISGGKLEILTQSGKG